MSPRAYLAQRSSRHGRMYISDEMTGTLSTGTVKKVSKCFLLEMILIFCSKDLYTRLSCLDVTAILSWGWLKLKWTSVELV